MTLSSRSRVTLLLVLLCTLLATHAPAIQVMAQDQPDEQAEPRTGAWIGWVYMENGGGDMPLRVWIHEDGSASYDGIPWRSYDWPAEIVQPGPGKLGLQTTSPKGTEIQMAGVFDGDHWSGHIRTGQFSGAFEMNAAGNELVQMDPAKYEDISGYYRMDDGDILVITSRSWGEMMVRSMRTGELRTLLPAGSDRFFTGPAVYLPTPKENDYQFLRAEAGDSDARGTVIGLRRTPPNGETIEGARFSLRSEDVIFEGDGVQLAGRVTRIDDDQVRTGLVLIGGSGWRERMDHAFRVHSLAALGYSVLSYDKRGFGESGGEDPVPFATSARDAAGGAQFLRSLDDVDEVGYAGISRGGWMAPLAASFDAQASFLILFVTPATSPATQEQDARLARMRQAGSSGADMDLADRMLDACWEFLEDETQWGSYYELALEVQRRGLPEYVIMGLDPDPQYWEWARMNMLYDPLPVLEQTELPVLAIFGERDFSVVTPINEPLMAQALRDAGNQQATLVVIPGVGHSLERQSDEPLHRRQGNGAEGFDAVMEWMGR